MTKTEARNLFGGRVTDLARAIGVTRGRIYQIPEELPIEIADRVRGAALRLGVEVTAVAEERAAA